MDWDNEHDFRRTVQKYAEMELDESKIESIHKQNMDQCNKNRRSIYLRDLKDDVGSLQQSEVIEAFLKICGLWKRPDGEFEPATRMDATYGHILMCPGPAGTGKSYVIDAIVTEIKDRYREKNKLINEENFDIMICGPTGKAALNIGYQCV